MDEDDEGEEGEGGVAEGLVRRYFGGILDDDGLLADEDDHESEGVDGDHDWNEATVHKGNEEEEEDLCSFRGVVEL